MIAKYHGLTNYGPINNNLSESSKIINYLIQNGANENDLLKISDKIESTVEPKITHECTIV